VWPGTRRRDLRQDSERKSRPAAMRQGSPSDRFAPKNPYPADPVSPMPGALRSAGTALARRYPSPASDHRRRARCAASAPATRCQGRGRPAPLPPGGALRWRSKPCLDPPIAPIRAREPVVRTTAPRWRVREVSVWRRELAWHLTLRAENAKDAASRQRLQEREMLRPSAPRRPGVLIAENCRRDHG